MVNSGRAGKAGMGSCLTGKREADSAALFLEETTITMMQIPQTMRPR